jgi:tetratricopeptide (TPR) repeat protein
MAPALQKPRHLLGLLHAEAGRHDLAAPVFAQALALDGHQPAVWRALAESQLRLGLAEAAVASLERAHGQLPHDALILDRLAIALREAGQQASALAKLEQALRIEPHNAQILCNYANLLFRLDRVDDALAAYENARLHAVGPAAQGVVLTNRARALADMGRAAPALADCDAALARVPALASAWVRRAEVLASKGQPGPTIEAVSAIETAVKLAPTSEDAHAMRTSLLVRDSSRAADALQASRQAFANLLAVRYASDPDGPATAGLRGRGMARFRLKHDVEQALHLQACGVPVPGLAEFLQVGRELAAEWAPSVPSALSAPSEPTPGLGPEAAPAWARPSETQLRGMLSFLRAPWLHPADAFAGACLNPDKDWRAVEQAYLGGNPELLWIDDFLSAGALAWFRAFCLQSRVWQTEYRGKYLGAFAASGFLSPVHLQLARELRQAMPNVFGNHELMQLWGFKYDATLGTGINMHADFALVNLNFWITPDEFNLEPDSGGMVVYDAPAPADWSFQQYNSGGSVIADFLKAQNAKPVKIAYRCNRAVLFNSALFHETDRIAFKDVYEGRRINMTYLFGRQLR